MSTALFHNFTDKEFIGYWNGKAKRFKPGVQMMMDAYLADHYAKHLVNKVLIEQGDFTSTSPKKPEQVPHFMELYNKAFILDEDSVEEDEAETNMRILNAKPLSSEIDERPARVTPPAPKVADDNEPQYIPGDVEDEDDESFEGKEDDSAPQE